MSIVGWVVGSVLAAAVYAWFTTWTGFLAVATAKRVRDQGVDLPLGGKVAVYIWLVLGLLGDFLYNAIIGTWVFKELPKWHKGELLYSARIERHYNESDGWRLGVAADLADVLNASDPGHIKEEIR